MQVLGILATATGRLVEEFAKAGRDDGELYHMVLSLYPGDPIDSADNVTIRLTEKRARREGPRR